MFVATWSSTTDDCVVTAGRLRALDRLVDTADTGEQVAGEPGVHPAATQSQRLLAAGFPVAPPREGITAEGELDPLAGGW